jgi:hypothetical protein
MTVDRYPINSPLVWFGVQRGTIRLWFAKCAFAFAGSFAVVRVGQSYEEAEKFDAWDKVGNLNVLWELMDSYATEAVMDRSSLKILFTSGIVIELRNTWEVPELVNIFETGVDDYIIARYPGDLSV